MSKIESQLDEKDREIREMAINRAEFIQQLNIIYDLLKKVRTGNENKKLINEFLKYNRSDLEDDIKKGLEQDKDKTKVMKKGTLNTAETTDINKKASVDLEPESLDILSFFEPDKLEFMGKYSYRERMIFMNRIDIYRLYVTIIILSSQMKYPRALTNIEEKELKDLIDELTEFENIVLDLNVQENLIWNKGKICEKRAIQLFTRFFNI